jgi:hypothetical protein
MINRLILHPFVCLVLASTHMAAGAAQPLLTFGPNFDLDQVGKTDASVKLAAAGCLAIETGIAKN